MFIIIFLYGGQSCIVYRRIQGKHLQVAYLSWLISQKIWIFFPFDIVSWSPSFLHYPDQMLLRTNMEILHILAFSKLLKCVLNSLCFSFSGGEESFCNAGNSGSTPELGRSPGEWNDNPLQYSCPGNPMDRGTWWATVHGIAKNWTQLSD